MNPVISSVEFENRVISAKYRNLMVRAKVVVVDKTSGISSPAPNGLLRLRLPDSVKPGTYYLKALDGHGAYAAQSVEFEVD
jgi:hypothetical protein